MATRLSPADLPQFIRATMCPDMPSTETFKEAGITYVHTVEFAEILRSLVETDPRFATGPGRATAYAWGVHMAADGIGHSAYIPADQRHLLVETEVDTIVYYDHATYHIPAGFGSWEATAVQPSDCSPDLVVAGAEVYVQTHGGSPISSTQVLEGTGEIAEWLGTEYAFIRSQNDSTSAETYLRAQGLSPFTTPYEQSVRAGACWITRDAAPANPKLLLAVATSPGQINLSWMDSFCDGTQLHIERKTGSEEDFQQIAQLSAADDGYSDTNLTAGTTYFYRAEACNTVGCSGYSAEIAATTPTTAPDVTTSDSSSGGGGCFIATAAFGSPLAPQVQFLREFRDRYLLSSAIGRTVVGWYYSVSPAWAKIIARSEILRGIVRVILLPLIGVAALILWSPRMTLGLLLLGISAGIWLPIRSRVGARDR